VEKLEAAQSALPEGLTQKILAQRKTIEGQRTQVTVMFCDMEGYAPVCARLGYDKVFPIMNEVFEVLIHNVHECGGTVNKITNDGIMAFFGTPIPLENAPQHAIRSALAINRDIEQLDSKLKGKHAIRPIKMCTGIHTGPIVIRSVSDDLRIEFTPIGDTVNLASSVEKLAEPGTTLVTEETFKLSKRLFNFDEIGERALNGNGTRIKVYKVVAPGSRRTMFDLSGEQGLKPFIGRERELEISMDTEEYKAACRDDISLKELDRKPKTYKGVKIKCQGEIMRKVEVGGTTDIILDITKDERSGEDCLFVWHDGITEAVENDKIQIWGEVRGTYVYTSAAGWKITLPLVRTEYIKVL